MSTVTSQFDTHNCIEAIANFIANNIDISSFDVLAGGDLISIIYVKNNVEVSVCVINTKTAVAHLNTESIQFAIDHANDFISVRIFKFCGVYSIGSKNDADSGRRINLGDPDCIKIVIDHCNKLQRALNRAWFMFKCKALSIVAIGLFVIWFCFWPSF